MNKHYAFDLLITGKLFLAMDIYKQYIDSGLTLPLTAAVCVKMLEENYESMNEILIWMFLVCRLFWTATHYIMYLTSTTFR